MTSSGHTGERAIHSSDFSAEKNPVGSMRSLAANAVSRSLFREQGLREKPETFSFIGNSTLHSLPLWERYTKHAKLKGCLSGPKMNQQHTVGSNRQYLRTRSRINVKVVKPDKGVRRGHPAATQISSRDTPLKRA